MINGIAKEAGIVKERLGLSSLASLDDCTDMGCNRSICIKQGIVANLCLASVSDSLGSIRIHMD